MLRRVDRAIGEFRRGMPILIHGQSRAILAQSVEGLREAAAAHLSRLAGGGRPSLILAARRAAALGWPAPEGVAAVRLSLREADHGSYEAIAHPSTPVEALSDAIAATAPAEDLEGAAIKLAKLSRLLPAALTVRLAAANPKAWAGQDETAEVRAEEIETYETVAARSLRQVADARVPLAGAENARVHAFRPDDGGAEHLAIVIGEPRSQEAVLARLHSECFTGDLLGSLRCDCGDQLRGAIEAIAEAGAGVLLYLAQEGRGIGLVNKLRAYRLQDAGADTLDANEALGFDADERVYLPAAEMLRQLGFPRIRLLTNNPEKVAGLQRCGIAVDERVAHRFPSNGHNDFYLSTKSRRFGHLP